MLVVCPPKTQLVNIELPSIFLIRQKYLNAETRDGQQAFDNGDHHPTKPAVDGIACVTRSQVALWREWTLELCRSFSAIKRSP
jgi:hypothetical protein